MTFNFNTLGSEVHLNDSKNSVPTSQKSHSVSIVEMNQPVLFRQIVAVYCENHYETSTLWQSAWFFNVKTRGAYSWQCAFKWLKLKRNLSCTMTLRGR
jgi:hypothetical protein